MLLVNFVLLLNNPLLLLKSIIGEESPQPLRQLSGDRTAVSLRRQQFSDRVVSAAQSTNSSQARASSSQSRRPTSNTAAASLRRSNGSSLSYHRNAIQLLKHVCSSHLSAKSTGIQAHRGNKQQRECTLQSISTQARSGNLFCSFEKSSHGCCFTV